MRLRRNLEVVLLVIGKVSGWRWMVGMCLNSPFGVLAGLGSGLGFWSHLYIYGWI